MSTTTFNSNELPHDPQGTSQSIYKVLTKPIALSTGEWFIRCIVLSILWTIVHFTVVCLEPGLWTEVRLELTLVLQTFLLFKWKLLLLRFPPQPSLVSVERLTHNHPCSTRIKLWSSWRIPLCLERSMRIDLAAFFVVIYVRYTNTSEITLFVWNTDGQKFLPIKFKRDVCKKACSRVFNSTSNGIVISLVLWIKTTYPVAVLYSL